MNNRESVLFAKIMAFAAIVFSSGGLLAGNSFVPLEYIESSGTQYIDTGVPASSVYAAELGMSVVSVKCDSQAYLGSANNDFAITSKATGNQWIRLMVRNVQKHADNTCVFTADTCNHVAVTNGVFSVNGLVLVSDIDTTQSLGSSANNVHVSGFVNGANKSAMRIYWVKLYGSDGALLADLVPAESVDGAFGLWDKTSSTFKANAGTGVFTPGSVTQAALIVDGIPEQYGTPSPDYGISAEFAIGQTAHLTAPATWASANDDERAEVTGWTLAKLDGTTIVGEGNAAEFVFTQDIAGGRLSWKWRRKYRVDISTKNVVGGATASAGSVWSDWDGKVSYTAPDVPSGADRFGYWDGAGIAASNMLAAATTGVVTEPGAVTACYVNKWAYDSATGKWTDGNWQLSTYGVSLNEAKGSGVLDLTHFTEDVESAPVLKQVNNRVFMNNALVTAFVGPNVVDVNLEAFLGASALRLAVFSDAVTFKDGGNFKDCASLERIEPLTVTNQTAFGWNVFNNCAKLAQPFDFPNLTVIDGHYFAIGAGFTAFNAPKLKSIVGACAFNDNKIAGRIYLPELTRMTSSFAGCPITELYAPKCVDFAGCYGCTELTNVVLSASITNIGQSAVESCSKLTGFYPRQFRRLRYIGASAFSKCTSLSGGFDFLWKGTFNINRYSLNAPHLTNIVFKTTVGSIVLDAFNSCEGLHLYFYQQTPPSIETNDDNPGLPYYRNCWLHVAHGATNQAWVDWMNGNAGATGYQVRSTIDRVERRDQHWANMQEKGTVPKKCFGILYFSFMDKYLLDWNPPEGFSITVR